MKKIMKQMAIGAIMILCFVFVMLVPATVQAAPTSYIRVKNITYSKYVNDKDFSIAYTKKNVKNIKWKTSNAKVATVNAKGKVSIKGPGTATITVTAKGTKVKKTFKAKTKIAVAQPYFSCDETKIVLKKGNTETVDAIVRNYPGYNIEWSSSNENAVSVQAKDENRAVITALDYESAVITASVEGIGSINIEVTVLEPQIVCPVNSVDISKGNYKYVYTTLKNIPSSDLIVWESSDLSKAEFVTSGTSNRTVRVVAKDYGTATITGYLGSKESGSSVSFEVNVPYPIINVDNTMQTVKVGKNKFVTASTQNMASEDHVEWMVDNPAILSIAASGSKNSKVTFTGLGEGDAVITGTVPGGNSVSIFVHVTK